MDWDWILRLAWFAALCLFTPGPNNMMLTSSGVNFGYQRSIPHMLGVSVGFAALLAPAAYGIGEAIQNFPPLRLTMQLLGSAALLWLAWKIALSGRSEAKATAKPLSFWQAVAFQFVNPKAWMIAVSVGSAFMQGVHPVQETLSIMVVFAITGLCSGTTWILFGVKIRKVLRSDRALRWFNYMMGGLLAASVVMLFIN